MPPKDRAIGSGNLYLLDENGITFYGYEEEKPSTFKLSDDGGFEIVPGVPDPLEHRAKLDFSKFHE